MRGDVGDSGAQCRLSGERPPSWSTEAGCSDIPGLICGATFLLGVSSSSTSTSSSSSSSEAPRRPPPRSTLAAAVDADGLSSLTPWPSGNVVVVVVAVPEKNLDVRTCFRWGDAAAPAAGLEGDGLLPGKRFRSVCLRCASFTPRAPPPPPSTSAPASSTGAGPTRKASNGLLPPASLDDDDADADADTDADACAGGLKAARAGAVVRTPPGSCAHMCRSVLVCTVFSLAAALGVPPTPGDLLPGWG